jgi:hypothetical protein
VRAARSVRLRTIATERGANEKRVPDGRGRVFFNRSYERTARRRNRSS